jgi:hypothetical protein
MIFRFSSVSTADDEDVEPLRKIYGTVAGAPAKPSLQHAACHPL